MCHCRLKHSGFRSKPTKANLFHAYECDVELPGACSILLAAGLSTEHARSTGLLVRSPLSNTTLSLMEILQVRKVGDTLISSSESTAHLSPSSAFPPILFYSRFAGYVRIPAKYLLTQDCDLCAGSSTFIC